MVAVNSKITFPTRQKIPKLFSQENFNLFDKITTAVYFLGDLRGDILRISNPVHAIAGYTPQQFLNQGLAFFLSLIHPDDYSELLNHYVHSLEAVSSGNMNHSMAGFEPLRLRIRHGKGHWLWIDIWLVDLDFSKIEVPDIIFGLFKESESQMNLPQRINRKLSRSRSVAPPNVGSPMVDLGLYFKEIEGLSAREMQVLRLIAHGFSSKMVADELSISFHTAINHRKNLISKFQVHNTAELICEASKKFWL